MWLRRWVFRGLRWVSGSTVAVQTDSDPGLVDRSSKPHRSPRRISAAVEVRVCGLRRQKRWGPARIAARLKM